LESVEHLEADGEIGHHDRRQHLRPRGGVAVDGQRLVDDADGLLEAGLGVAERTPLGGHVAAIVDVADRVEVVRVAEAEGGVLAPQVDTRRGVDGVRAVVVLEAVGVAGVDGSGAEAQLGAAVEGVARVGEMRRRRDGVGGAVDARSGARDHVGLVAEVEREVAVGVDVEGDAGVEHVQRLLAAGLAEVLGLDLDLVLGARDAGGGQQH
jgi:hypothetical protein